MSDFSATLTLDQWQIRFHEAMAALLRAQETVKRQLGIWGLVKDLWKCTRDLKALKKSLKAISEMPDGVLSQEFIESHISQVGKVLRSIEGLQEAGKRKGLTNRSLTAMPLGLIALHGEYIGDYLDSLKLSIDPEVLEAIAQGRGQIERGEFEVMGQLF